MNGRLNLLRNMFGFCRCNASLAVCLLACAAQCHALDIFWRNPDGGAFGSTGNWTGGLVPSNTDVAHFGVSVPVPPFLPPPFTVTFSANVTNQALVIHDDLVVFDLNTRTYATTTAAGIAVGNNAGSLGSLTVTDGTINVTAGLATPAINVGAVANGRGTLVVGSAGRITGSPNLNVGHLHTGGLAVTSGGVVSIGTNTSTIIGNNAGVTGTATITGVGSALTTNGLTIGNSGNGTLNLDILGMLQVNANSVMGNNTGSTAIANVTNSAQWITTGNLTVGNSGQSTLNISGVGLVRNVNGVVGVGSSGSGTVTVEGGNSLWHNTGSLTVGDGGESTLSVTNGGRVQSDVGIIASLLGSIGRVDVDGAGSRWDNTGDLFVGGKGRGFLNITAGGTVRADQSTVGNFGTGNITVNGAGSLWDITNGLTVGNVANSTLSITNGGHVQSNGGIIAALSNPGRVTVDGDGSRWQNGGNLIVGEFGHGTLEITDGGIAQNANATVGDEEFGTGHVTVDGGGSLWKNNGFGIGIGSAGDGTLEITAGGTVENVNGSLGDSATGTGLVTVDGVGSLWNNTGTLTIGRLGAGTLHITNGAIVTSNGDASIARFGDATSTVTVSSTIAGADSIWDIGARLGVGGDVIAPVPDGDGGVGTLRIQPGGKVIVAEDTVVFAGDLLSLEGGTLSSGEIRFRFGGSVGANFEWTSGTLHIGVFDGDLANSAGVLAPGNSIGATEILGNYNQLTNGTLEIEIGPVGQGAQNDSVSVTGTATIDGQLTLSLIIGADPLSSQTFIILDANTLAGSFDNIASGQRLTTVDGLGSFLVHYGAGSAFDPKQVVLSAFEAIELPGDYNQNGVVDAADYVIWRNNLGSGTSLPNDDTSGVGPDDYTRWKTNFGRTLGSSGAGASFHLAPGESPGANYAVPEPSILVLISIGGLHAAAGAQRRLNRRRQPRPRQQPSAPPLEGEFVAPIDESGVGVFDCPAARLHHIER